MYCTTQQGVLTSSEGMSEGDSTIGAVKSDLTTHGEIEVSSNNVQLYRHRFKMVWSNSIYIFYKVTIYHIIRVWNNYDASSYSACTLE